MLSDKSFLNYTIESGVTSPKLWNKNIASLVELENNVENGKLYKLYRWHNQLNPNIKSD
jgi:hypothetical protein